MELKVGSLVVSIATGNVGTVESFTDGGLPRVQFDGGMSRVVQSPDALVAFSDSGIELSIETIAFAEQMDFVSSLSPGNDMEGLDILQLSASLSLAHGSILRAIADLDDESTLEMAATIGIIAKEIALQYGVLLG